MTELLPFLDLIRVVCLLVIVICQVVIAHSMYVFSRHNVVAFSTGELAMLTGVSAGILAIATLLTIVKLAVAG